MRERGLGSWWVCRAWNLNDKRKCSHPILFLPTVRSQCWVCWGFTGGGAGVDLPRTAGQSILWGKPQTIINVTYWHQYCHHIIWLTWLTAEPRSSDFTRQFTPPVLASSTAWFIWLVMSRSASLSPWMPPGISPLPLPPPPSSLSNFLPNTHEREECQWHRMGNGKFLRGMTDPLHS